jgi:hypothetical protein
MRLNLRCAAAVISIGLLSAVNAGAADYTFTNIADTSTEASIGTFTDFFGGRLAISGGTVAFWGGHDDLEGVFTGRGGALTTIAKTGDPAPSGAFSVFDPDPAISDNLTAFTASYSSISEGIFSGSGGALTVIAKTGDAAPVGTFRPFEARFSPPAISGAQVAFAGAYTSEQGVFTGTGGPLTTIATTGDATPNVGTFI